MICTKSMPLILASSSPRRRGLLAGAGYEFEIVEPPIDESDSRPGGLSPIQWAEALAYFKARCVRERRPDRCVLAADTLVCVGEQVLGKPADGAEARRMLRTLSGTRHSVITGVALLGPVSRRLIASDTTYVTMRALTGREVDQYVQSGEWIGKAGAYAIQETADRFVENIEGSFSNIVGLPMELVGRMVRTLGELPATRCTM